MMNKLIAICAIALCAAVFVSGVSVDSPSDVDSLLDLSSAVNDIDTFVGLLETQSALEDATDANLEEEDFAMMEMGAEATATDNPSYTLAYPAVTYASQAAGGFFHPYSNVNPLAAPFSGFAPVAAPVAPLSAAAIANSPLSYYAAGLGVPAPLALGLAGAFPTASMKGGYNEHGLVPAGADGMYHPGLQADLTSLGGHEAGGAAAPEAAAFLESGNEPENMEASSAEAAYGLFPAPTPSSPHFKRDGMASLGAHSLQIEEVGANEVDQDFPAMMEVTHYVESLESSNEEADAEAEAEAEEAEAEFDEE